MLTLSRHIHLRQLLLVELVEGQLDWADGVEQIAVALQTDPGGDGCVFCTNELPLLCMYFNPHLLGYAVTSIQEPFFGYYHTTSNF